jgi:hypothetical protein
VGGTAVPRPPLELASTATSTAAAAGARSSSHQARGELSQRAHICRVSSGAPLQLWITAQRVEQGVRAVPGWWPLDDLELAAMPELVGLLHPSHLPGPQTDSCHVEQSLRLISRRQPGEGSQRLQRHDRAEVGLATGTAPAGDRVGQAWPAPPLRGGGEIGSHSGEHGPHSRVLFAAEPDEHPRIG